MFQFKTQLGILVWVSSSALVAAANFGVLSPGKMYNIELDAFYLKIKPVSSASVTISTGTGGATGAGGGQITLNSGRATGSGGSSNP